MTEKDERKWNACGRKEQHPTFAAAQAIDVVASRREGHHLDRATGEAESERPEGVRAGLAEQGVEVREDHVAGALRVPDDRGGAVVGDDGLDPRRHLGLFYSRIGESAVGSGQLGGRASRRAAPAQECGPCVRAERPRTGVRSFDTESALVILSPVEGRRGQIPAQDDECPCCLDAYGSLSPGLSGLMMRLLPNRPHRSFRVCPSGRTNG